MSYITPDIVEVRALNDFYIYLKFQTGEEKVYDMKKYIDQMEYEKPKNKEGGTIPYMAALKAFDTEEWLDVTIDNVAYRI